MKDVSLDFETLSLEKNAMILSIGAVYFDRYTGALGARFERVIDLDHPTAGGHISASTVSWWMRQTEAVRDRVFSPSVNRVPLVNALVELNQFLGFHDALPEGKTPDVSVWTRTKCDQNWMESAIEGTGLAMPIRFYQWKDEATLTGLFKEFLPKRTGDHHSALDDAIYQAECLGASFARLYATGALLPPPLTAATAETIARVRANVAELGYCCGLETIGEAIDNVVLHAANMWEYEDIAQRQAELYQAFSEGERGLAVADMIPEARRRELDDEMGLIISEVAPSSPPTPVLGPEDNRIEQ
jgi:exodeoxyribonuclease VIII